MAVAPFAIIAGPGKVWAKSIGVGGSPITMPSVGTAEDAAEAIDANWTAAEFMGRTEGGVTVRNPQNIELLGVDQVILPLKGIRTEASLEVEYQIAEINLERYAKLMNDALVTTDPGPPAVKHFRFPASTEVVRFSVLVRFPSPYENTRAQIEIPVAIQSGEPEMTFVKDDKATLAVTWQGLEDPANLGTFGRIIAKTSAG
jgi:hypothetical protein